MTSGADVNAQTEYHVTPLMLACHSGDVESVKSIVDSKARINDRMESGYVPVCLSRCISITNSNASRGTLLLFM